ncbi:hypothetical protein ACJ72_06589 [Emergomyces africanus]|uniref:RING-type domain-containing protein n=1 Tax=Emergomyces africanus TaxID=1955775 RepID=A0A1B7NQJ6_9EURO|nr:hypothetical protein ACJ72_06589 [Emergomyces africanus]
MPSPHYIYIPFSSDTLSVKELDQAEMRCFSGASIEKEEEKNEAKETDCILCFETLRGDMSFRELPCQHIFHKPCIDTWLSKREARCPLCRQTFYHLKRPQILTTSSMSDDFAVTSTLQQNDQSLPPLPSSSPEPGSTHCRGPWEVFNWWRRHRHRRRGQFDVASQHPNAASSEYMRDGVWGSMPRLRGTQAQG